MANDKKKTTTATVAYILDPDLAIPDIIDRSFVSIYGLKTRGVRIPFKNKKANIKARGPSKQTTKAALDLIIDEIAPFIDLLVNPSLGSIDEPTNNMVVIKDEITSSEYGSLNSFGKQLYVKATDALYDRYITGSDYAGLSIPPPGRFGRLSSLVVKDESIKVRGQTSKNKAGTRHMLVRLNDGSLLEFYTTGSTITDNKVETFFNKIIVQEPVVLKKFIIAPGLTNYLGRPAYDIDAVIAVAEGNEKLSTVPQTTEEVEYYNQQVPIEELIEVSEDSVLELSSILPSTLFFVGGDNMIEGEYKKNITRLVQKYSPSINKSARHRTAFLAQAKLNSTTTSRYFDNTIYGGSNKDLLHPMILEAILDEYIADKSRNSFIDAAIPLLAGEGDEAAMALSGYHTNKKFPSGSEMGSFLSTKFSSLFRTIPSILKTPITPTPSIITTTPSTPAPTTPPLPPSTPTTQAITTKPTREQMFEKGKQLLGKYLPEVFGEEDKTVSTPSLAKGKFASLFTQVTI